MSGPGKRGFTLDFEAPIYEIEDEILKLQAVATSLDVGHELKYLRERIDHLRATIYSHLTPSQRMQVARHPQRPTTLDYIQALGADFMELHGDRHGADDQAMVGGIVHLAEGGALMAIGHQKGKDTKDNIKRNFGMPQPAGFRKARRLMEHADRFGLPIVTFVDSPGAYPGVEAEATGQGEAIAANLMAMAGLRVPVVSVVTGEGGSGGALAIGVGNRFLMLEHAYYSVITPEGCAAILWRDAKRAPEAAAALKITAPDLQGLGVVDEVVPEPLGGAHAHPADTVARVKAAVLRHLAALRQLSPEALVRDRYQKFRGIAFFADGQG